MVMGAWLLNAVKWAISGAVVPWVLRRVARVVWLFRYILVLYGVLFGLLLVVNSCIYVLSSPEALRAVSAHLGAGSVWAQQKQFDCDAIPETQHLGGFCVNFYATLSTGLHVLSTTTVGVNFAVSSLFSAKRFALKDLHKIVYVTHRQAIGLFTMSIQTLGTLLDMAFEAAGLALT